MIAHVLSINNHHNVDDKFIKVHACWYAGSGIACRNVKWGTSTPSGSPFPSFLSLSPLPVPFFFLSIPSSWKENA